MAKLEIKANDITTNLPYVDGVYMAFDHHFSETFRMKKENHIIDPNAPKVMIVLFLTSYGGDEVFPGYFTGMMNGANKADSADFIEDDILTKSLGTHKFYYGPQEQGLGDLKILYP